MNQPQTPDNASTNSAAAYNGPQWCEKCKGFKYGLYAGTPPCYCVCNPLEEKLTEKTNEVARLRDEANTWHRHYRDEASKAQKCKQAYIEKEKEVARLREEVKKWKQLFVNFAVIHCGQFGEQNFGKDYLHPLHYDLLKEAGARMVNFKRAEIEVINPTEK